MSGFPWLSDAVEGSTSGVFSLHRETKFIIGFDFAVTVSSPAFSCVLFDITPEPSVELKMDTVEQTQKMIISCEMSLGQFVCDLVFGVKVFGIQIDSIEQPIKSNSVGSGNMSHCRASSLHNHLDHCFVVFKHIQQSFFVRRNDV